MIGFYVVGFLAIFVGTFYLIYSLIKTYPKNTRRGLLKKMHDEGDIDNDVYIKYNNQL